jgi:hypothetical protein
MAETLTKLEDLAHVFHGVGNADIFTDVKLSKIANRPETVDCRVIKAPDIMSLRPWHEPDQISHAKVSKRLIFSEKRRGLGQSCKLQRGDLLLTTRGVPKISPMITYQITQGGDIVAGPEILVIRAKAGVSAAALRKAIKQRSTAAYFESRTTRKNRDKKAGEGYDKSGVLSKEAVCGLPIPNELKDARPRFGEDIEILAHKAESLLSGIQSLNHAIIEAARWRAEQQTKPLEISQFPHRQAKEFSWEKTYQARYTEIQARAHYKHSEVLEEWKKDVTQPVPDWDWNKPYDRERDQLIAQRLLWTSEGLCKCITSLSSQEAPSGDAAILCRLLTGTESAVASRESILGDRNMLEATTMLLQQGDERASSTKVARSIRSLLAACAGSQDCVAILMAEAGHLAHEVMSTERSPASLALVEENQAYRNVAKTICELHGKRTRIEAVERAFHLRGELRFDIVLLEASGADFQLLDGTEKTKEKSSEIFQWHMLRSRIKDSGRMIAHIPTTHWKMLSSVMENVSTVLQLPPICLPVWHADEDRKYVPCDQGLLVVIKPECGQGEPVRVVDATRINNGHSVTDLSPGHIELLRSILLEESAHLTAVSIGSISRSALREFDIWPGIAALMNKPIKPSEQSDAYTLESMVEFLKYKHHLWKQTQAKVFKGVGLLPGL